MSFLAQLQAQQRTNSTETNQTLSLYYLLDVKGDNNLLPILALSLVVADCIESTYVTAGSTGEPFVAKPYSPQKQHILMPPPFIQRDDIDVLTLLTSNTCQNGWPNLPIEQGEEFWRRVCNTQRLYFRQYVTGKPLKVTPIQKTSSSLKWQQDVNGNQILTATTTTEKQIFQKNNPFDLLEFGCLNTIDRSVSMSVCNIELAGAAIDQQQILEITKYFPDSNVSLRAAAIPDFLLINRDAWNRLRLPLPEISKAELLGTQLRGAVICENRYFEGKNRDICTLGFIYISKHYCTWFASDDIDDHFVVLNDSLFVIERKLDQEAVFGKSFKNYFKKLSQKNDVFTADTSTVWLNFFIGEKIDLEKSGFIFRIAKSFKSHYIQAEGWFPRLQEKSNGSLQVDLFVGIHHSEPNSEQINIIELLGQIQRFNLQQNSDDIQLTLNDGRILLMPAEKLISLTEEFGDLLVSGRSSISLHKHQSSRLSQLENILPTEAQWHGDIQALEISRQLKQSPHIFEQSSCGVNATLRPYQWLGVCWMQHLKGCGVNGLLADDMGLGKTLQTIAHLSLEYRNNEQLEPSLIVVPTSLLHNWLNEFSRFAPHLKVIIHHGAQRKNNYVENTHHIMLTSYQLIINDNALFKNQDYSWLILDEAQNIKNPRTKTHLAVKELRATHKMCLSGTPVENNLVELWAILNFLMPSCLGSLNEFKFHYQKPIEQDGNNRKMELLLNRIAPFMLRRTKRAVAPDLPEKTEIHQAIDLGEQQSQFYESIKSNTWQELQLQLDGAPNTAEQQIFVLSALLKLRQACCDPELLNETNIPSAKRQHCIEMATELAKEGRGILIFSQFTSMLDILAREFAQLGIDFGLLTGKTRNRQQLVDQFQAGAFPVFLISLKAGGVGLNLTRADTVIHYDPWWNSAAEQQASDRAHRIGQQNNVFVYKLIANNTIEEKIAALQARKAALGQYVNQQAQQTGVKFSVGLEELLSLWQDDKENFNASSNIGA